MTYSLAATWALFEPLFCMWHEETSSRNKNKKETKKTCSPKHWQHLWSTNSSFLPYWRIASTYLHCLIVQWYRYPKGNSQTLGLPARYWAKHTGCITIGMYPEQQAALTNPNCRYTSAKLKWDLVGYICRMPTKLSAMITTKLKPTTHNGDEADGETQFWLHYK